MDNAINFSVSPLQALLALAFQMWLVIFPILLLRKMNYIQSLLEARENADEEES